MWQKKRLEDEYNQLVYKSLIDMEQNSIFNKYLGIEDGNERLARLKCKFGNQEGSQYHMKSIYLSKTYENNKPRKEADPSYNFMKNVSF